MNSKLLSKYRKCPKPGHNHDQILMICMDARCKQNLLCCCTCVDEEHQKHEIISLLKLETQMQEILQRNNKNMQKAKITKIFSEYAAQFLNSFKTLETTLISQIHALQQQMNRIFFEVYRTLSIPSHDSMIENLNSSPDVSDWSNVLEDIRLCQKYHIGTAKETQMVLDHEFNIFHQKLTKVRKQLKTNVQFLKEQIKSFNFKSKKYEELIQFHKIYKYYEMTRLDNPAFISKQKNNGNRTIALGNRPLDPINNTVSFRIIKNGDGIPSICIGAAILNIVKQNNFTNCLGYKRGTYGIDQAMTSNWGSMQESHEATEQNQDEQTNNTGIGFQFTEGDTVILTIDFSNQTLLFEKDEDVYQMQIDCSHREIYPFVSLSNTNSIVQIIN